MKTLILLSSVVTLTLTNAIGAAKPAEKLLPENTMAVITFRDLSSMEKAYENAPFSKFMKDPALQPFLKKAEKSVKKNLLEPIEEKLALDLAELGNLCEGQLTFAIIPSPKIIDAIPTFVVLSDVGAKKGKAEALLQRFKSELKKNDVDFSNARIQGNSFIQIAIPEEGVTQQMPLKAPEAFYLGLSNSLLVMGTDKSVVDNIVISNQGGTPPSLSQNSAFRNVARTFQPNFDSMGWLNLEPLIGMVPGFLKGQGGGDQGPDPLVIFEALGISGLKGASFHSRRENNGEFTQLTLHVPKAERKGLFKIFIGDEKPAGPLPILPANVASFSRSRLDLKESFTGMEQLVTKMSPEMGGLMQFMLAGIGKDKDKNYDFKRDFIGNLGDDLVTVVLPTDGDSLESLAMQKQLFMIGSSAPDKLLYSAKILSSLIPNLEMKSTDFLGKKILSADLPSPAGQDFGLYMTSNKGYLVITQNRQLLEQIIRGRSSAPNKIASTSEFKAAVERVGGTGSGLFGFEDAAKSVEPIINIIKNEPEMFQEIIDNVTSSIADTLNEDSTGETWFDLSILPDASAIARYLGVSVYAGQIDNNGFNLKIFAADPSGL